MDDSRRLWFRSRRGTRELDELLSRFMAVGYVDLPGPEKEAFATLLDCNDAELIRWLMGMETPDDEATATIVERIRRVTYR